MIGIGLVEKIVMDLIGKVSPYQGSPALLCVLKDESQSRGRPCQCNEDADQPEALLCHAAAKDLDTG